MTKTVYSGLNCTTMKMGTQVLVRDVVSGDNVLFQRPHRMTRVVAKVDFFYFAKYEIIAKVNLISRNFAKFRENFVTKISRNFAKFRSFSFAKFRSFSFAKFL
jgi:hypothetical protein